MAEFTPNFNLKKPNEYEFYNIDDFNENMDIIDQKLKEAGQNEQLQSDVTEIKTDIGSPSDISSSPTIFGKLAEIKETLTTKFIEIISKITGIDSKIGTTTDTGGTSSAGGIFAKLNKLLTDWTTTRASRIDDIYTATTTNNTASTTGTLSQKLSSAINTLSSILTNTNASTTSSSTGTLSQKLNYIRILIGTGSDNGTTTLFGLLKGLSSKGIVKSVQRGVTTNTSITISTVNPQKCLVILNNSFLSHALNRSSDYSSYVYGSIVKSLTENNLTITKNYYEHSSDSYKEVSWQVIEFY